MASEHGVNFVQNLADSLGVGSLESVLSAGIVAGGLLVVGVSAARQLRVATNPLVPESTLTKRNLFELIGEGLMNLGDMAMGRENRKFLPFLAALFTYVFSSNLLGLIPGFSMPTDSIAFNLGIAVVVFVMYNYWGVREVGMVNYLKHLWGPVLLLGPFLFVIEMISHFIRPITLSLRLFGNMTGDHTVVAEFSKLTQGTVGFWIPVIFMCLGTFVCLIQAFVFTVLTMVYIRLAVAHEEHEEGGDSHHH